VPFDGIPEEEVEEETEVVAPKKWRPKAN
jgi:hypothetical protein